MKTLFKVLALGIFLTAFSAIAFGQTPTAEDLAADFEKYKLLKNKPCGQRSEAVQFGKTTYAKFKDVAEVMKDNEAVVNFIRDDSAKVEMADAKCAREKRYNDSYKAKNWAEFLSASKEVMNAEGDTPLGLDVLLTHVSIAYDRVAVDNNAAYNNETIEYAKKALQRLEAGQASQTKKYGVFLPFDTKENATGWMNYIIGWTMYNKLDQKKDALHYLYKATQINSEKKNDTVNFTSIGGYYFSEAARLFEEYTAKRKANNNEETDEIKALLALSRGYADRAIDAFGRAHKIAVADKAVKPEFKTALYTRLIELYKFRFNLAADAQTPDLDKYVSDLVAKPMPDPSTAVTPVVEEVKPATTTTTSTTTTTPATTTTTTTPKPTTTNKQPTSATTTNGTSETTATTTKAKTTVKKPVTKKKGTR